MTLLVENMVMSEELFQLVVICVGPRHDALRLIRFLTCRVISLVQKRLQKKHLVEFGGGLLNVPRSYPKEHAC